MPQYKQPESLVALCHTTLAQELVGLCRLLQNLAQDTSPTQALTTAQTRMRPVWISSLPGCVRTKLLEQGSSLLASPVPDTGTMGAGPVPLYLLSLLLAPDIHKLRVELCCYYGCSHQAALLRLLAFQGSGLESLQLARSALLRLDQNLLQSALQSATSLRQLILHNIASDSILGVIGRSCPNLTHLDVAHSRQVTDAGMRQLFLQIELRDKNPLASKYSHSLARRNPLSAWSRLRNLFRLFSRYSYNRRSDDKLHDVSFLLEYCESRNELCETLRVLNIANTGVTSTGVLLALRSSPNLESLGEYCHMGRALEVLEKTCGTAGVPQLQIRIARSSRTTTRKLELLANSCPLLQRLSLCEPHLPPDSLHILPTTLTALILHGVPSYPAWIIRLYKFLEGPHGKNLRELTIRFFIPEFLTPLDLGNILQNCKKLRSFILDGANVDWSEDKSLILPELERVQLGKIITYNAVTKLLMASPELKIVHFHTCIDLTDKHLIQANNPLIECFYIYEVTSCISAGTVHNLMGNFPNLKYIGNLANWGLGCDDIRQIMSTIRDNNYDLQLNAGSHWFCSKCFSPPHA